MFNPLHIAGNDKFNEAIDKVQQQQVDERRHQDTLREQRKANEISAQALEEAQKANKLAEAANRKSKSANRIAVGALIISELSVIAGILIGIYT